MAKATRYTQEMIEEYAKRGVWTAETQADIWDRNAREAPDKEALVDSRGRLTWAEVKHWTDRIALTLLDMGLTKDDSVVVQLPTCKELLMMLIACEKAGLLYVPVMYSFGEKELRYIIGRTNARCIVIPWKFRNVDYYETVQKLLPESFDRRHILFWGDEHPNGMQSLGELAAQPMEEKHPADRLQHTMMPPFEVSFVRPTSGTTGMPKLVELPSCCRVFQGRTLVKVLEMTDNDIVAALSPVAGGPNTVPYLGGPMARAKIVMLQKWEPEEALKLIESEGVSVLSAVPTQLCQMVQHPHFSRYDLSSMRVVVGGMGQGLDYQLGAEIEEKFGCPVVNGFGATEWGGTLMPMPSDPREWRLGSVGKSSDKSEIMIVDANDKEVPPGEAGELLLGGPAASSGYFMDVKGTAEIWIRNAWLRTGDMARTDANGNIVICGRIKDMIIRGGLNIYPAEIEHLLLGHPGISEAAVVGMPDPVMGEKLCAYVSPREGTSITFQEMVAFLKEQGLAAVKIPERLELLHKLPLGLTGEKIDKAALRSDVAGKLKTEVCA